jgi:hypothetical protein
MFTAAYYIRNIASEIIARRGEAGEMRLIADADNTRPDTLKVREPLCDDSFLRIAPHTPY